MAIGKNARSTCVVFADAFSYAAYIALEKPLTRAMAYRLIPGVGYSSNLHYTLFQGKMPDDVGFFTDYAYVGSDMSAYEVCGIKKTADRVATINNVYRYVRKKATGNASNIPFSEEQFFTKKGRYLFMQEGDCDVFGCRALKCYEKDYRKSFERAMDNINSPHIVVVLEDLDHMGHEFGGTSPECMNRAQEIVELSEALFDSFKTVHDNPFCLLISDHGMGDVRAGIDIMGILRDRFGSPGKDYRYYCDTIYLRTWYRSETTRMAIRRYLNTLDVLVLLTDKERFDNGLTDSLHGEDIYRLREGYMFSPNCFDIILHAMPKGLHGYMEPTDKSSGIVVSYEEIGACKPEVGIPACKIFNECSKVIGINS